MEAHRVRRKQARRQAPSCTDACPGKTFATASVSGSRTTRRIVELAITFVGLVRTVPEFANKENANIRAMVFSSKMLQDAKIFSGLMNRIQLNVWGAPRRMPLRMIVRAPARRRSYCLQFKVIVRAYQCDRRPSCVCVRRAACRQRAILVGLIKWTICRAGVERPRNVGWAIPWLAELVCVRQDSTPLAYVPSCACRATMEKLVPRFFSVEIRTFPSKRLAGHFRSMMSIRRVEWPIPGRADVPALRVRRNKFFG